MLACYCYLCASTTSFSAHWLVLRKLFTKNLEKASRLLGKEGRSLRQEGSWNTGVADKSSHGSEATAEVLYSSAVAWQLLHITTQWL